MTAVPEPPELLDLAERQWGMVTRRQAMAAGLTRSAWRHLACDRWERLTPRVARLRGVPQGPEQRAMAAVLDVGPSAYLSHRSGAAQWGVPGFELEPIELIVVRGGAETRTELATVHRPRHLPDPYGTILDGLPVVRPALLVLQLASLVSARRLGRIFDHLWSRRLLSGPSVRRELGALLHRGRPGVAALREVLDQRGEGYVPPATGLEGRVREILQSAGIAPLRQQVDLGDDERWCGRVDFVDEELPLILEVDSDRFHLALADREADEARQRKLERAGFVVQRVDEHQVWHRPQEVVDAVRAGRRLASRAA